MEETRRTTATVQLLHGDYASSAAVRRNYRMKETMNKTIALSTFIRPGCP